MPYPRNNPPDQFTYNGEKFKRLGEGSLNIAYVNEARTLVIKIKYEEYISENQPFLKKADEAERSVRLWNIFNKSLMEAKVIEVNGIPAWICPFVQGEEPTDEELSEAVIDQFNKTGRIVVDATSIKNFIKNPQGEIVCVDIGFALQLEDEEEKFLRRKRRGSEVSLGLWKEMHDVFNKQTFPAHSKAGFPQSVQTVKALLFIRKHRPDISNTDFLKKNTNVIKELATAYDADAKGSFPSDNILRAKETLSLACPTTLANAKNACLLHLQRYIHSRGIIQNNEIKSETVQLFLVTSLFRNQNNRAVDKIRLATQLINRINEASSIDEVWTNLRNAEKSPLFKGTTFSGDLIKAVRMCKIIAQTEMDNENKIDNEDKMNNENKY